jgi:RNA polymerase sigma factor (sigma-70 family)
MLDETDAVLLSRYQEYRAEEAFAELVRRHIDGVYSAAIRRLGGDTHLAEDVTQIVFTALARQADRLSTHAFLTGWLYAATRNHAVTLVRRERRRRVREEKADPMNQIFSDEPAMDWSQMAPILDSLLDRLGEADRNAVLLRFVDRRAFAEIGIVMQLSEDAARMRVDRALGKLRVLLARKGITSCSAALGLALADRAAIAAPVGLAETVAATALGAAPAAVTGTLTALKIMSTTKSILTAAAIATAVAGIGTAIYEYRTGRAIKVSLAAADQANETLLTQRRTVESSLKAAQATLANLRPAAAISARTEETVPKWNPLAEGRAFLGRHPEVRATLDARERALCLNRFGPLLNSLNLTSDQTDRFVSLMLTTSYGIGFPYGPGGASLVLRSADGEVPTMSDLRAQLLPLIGAAGVQQFGQIMRTESSRDLATSVASTLAYSEAPLDPQQATELAQSFARNTIRGSPGGPQVNWEGVQSQASAFLSPAQIESFAGVRAQAEAESALQRASNVAAANSARTAKAAN